MSISQSYSEPGVYSQFKPATSLATIPGGIRVAALVGTGRTTNLVKSEVVTKGTLDGFDALAHTAVSLGSTILDQDFNSYSLGIDYQLGTGLNAGKVDWSLSSVAALTGTIVGPYSVVGKSFQISVAGGANQSYTFVSGDFVVPTAGTASEVASALSAQLTGVTVTVNASAVEVATVAVNNTSLLIGTGTANADLGFADGSLVLSPKEPVAGKTYFVDYQYAKASATDYVPTFFFSMDDVTAAYGDVDPSVGSLSVGAEIVFQQGASAVCLIQVDPADGAVSQQFRKALDKLLPVTGINIVVALSTDQSLFSYIKNHVDQASSLTERHERTAILGMGGIVSVASAMTVAQGLADKRIVLVFPTSATRFVGALPNAVTLDGSYLAAAISGIRTSQAYDVADPLTRKEPVGFENIPDVLLRAEKNQLANAGICVIENVGGIFRVRHGLTTDVSLVENREYSVVEIIDYVAVSMRQLLEAIYIGQKILLDTPSQIRSTIAAVLNDLIRREIITAQANITAVVDSLDPTQINVSFQIQPVFPLNFVFVSFSLNV